MFLLIDMFFAGAITNDILNGLTIILCVAIVIATIWALYFIHNAKATNTIPQKKKWIDQLPSLISTAGVMGTFLGIAIGLTYFDVSNIGDSIGNLLEGLKTAFYTSLFGMAGSMILTRYVNLALDSNDFEEELEDKSTKKVVEAISNLQTAITIMNNETTTEFKDSVNSSLGQIKESLNQMKDDIEEMKGHMEEIKEKSSNIDNSVETRLSQIGGVCLTATASLSKIDNCTYSIEKAVTSLCDKQEVANETLRSLNNKQNR